MRNPFRGRPEIGRRDADRLLDRDQPVDPAHRAIADLLTAAAGRPLPHETKGERAAVRRFRQAYAASARTTSRRHPRRVGALVTATAAAMLVGGTAYAGWGGHLPESLQRTAHDWFSVVGVPAPDQSRSPSPAPDQPSPSPSSAQEPGSPSVVPSASVLRDVCLAWQAIENDPRARPITADERHQLGDAAGSNGKKQIDDFCERLLAPSPAATTTPTTGRDKPGNPSPGPKKSHP